MTTRTFEDVVGELGKAYDKWKGGEKSKDKLKKEFFELAVHVLNGETLAEKVVEIDEIDDVKAKEICEKRYPGWIPDDMREHPEKEGVWEIIIREDPFFKPFTYEHNGRVFERQIVSGESLLDDERLQAEDPDLWEAVTYFPEPERTLKDFDDLDGETLTRLQAYMYQGPPKVRFPAPQKVKDDS